MKDRAYEKHVHEDPDFPFIFHLDAAHWNHLEETFYHWHENLEILNCVEGSCVVVVKGNKVLLQQGETLFIDPLSMHSILKTDNECRYYCLIIDKRFFMSMGAPAHIRHKPIPFCSEKMDGLFEKIAAEYRNKELLWKQAVRSFVTQIAILYCRNSSCLDCTAAPGTSQNETAGRVMEYLYENYLNEVSIDKIAEVLGYNKYYLCHAFKNATGESIISYLNMLRCNYAGKLLLSGHYTVGEAAELSGFSSMSYFSKMYGRYFNRLPSADKKKMME